MTEQVERIAASDRAALERCVRSETPVVIEGAARGWRAVVEWSPAYLVERIGDVAIRYKRSESNVHPDFHAATLAAMFATGATTFAEFVAAITGGDLAERARSLFTGDEQFLLRRRDGQTSINDALRPLLDDVAVPEIAEDRLYTVWAWFSGIGVRTWLHYDNNGCHNLNAQITGSKRCALFPPSELARLAPFPLGGANPAHNCSQLDIDRVDLADGAQLTARLDAGDLLFIPAWWFHTFLHLGEFNSNVNFWWKPETPSLNPVAARQVLLDAVRHANLDVADLAVRGVLERLDRAIIGT